MAGMPGGLASLGVGHGGMAAAAAAASRLGLTGFAPPGGHHVLLVSNLNPEVSTLTRPKPLYIIVIAVLRNVKMLQCHFVYATVH